MTGKSYGHKPQKWFCWKFLIIKQVLCESDSSVDAFKVYNVKVKIKLLYHTPFKMFALLAKQSTCRFKNKFNCNLIAANIW